MLNFIFIFFCQRKLYLTPPGWELISIFNILISEKSKENTTLETEPLRWANGLSDLVRSDTGKELFAKFLKTEFSAENLTVWLQIGRYRRSPSK